LRDGRHRLRPRARAARRRRIRRLARDARARHCPRSHDRRSGAGAVYGWAWHREPAAYGYISRSIERFVTGDELTAALKRRGFDVYHVAQKLLGGICVHAARKI
jgi:hypothetical protein